MGHIVGIVIVIAVILVILFVVSYDIRTRNNSGSQEMINKSESVNYYYFNDFDVVCKEENNCWYRRDTEKHKWIQQNSWMGRYFDAGYSVIAIEYDEKNEKILSRSKIKGFWFADQDELLKDDKD